MSLTGEWVVCFMGTGGVGSRVWSRRRRLVPRSGAVDAAAGVGLVVERHRAAVPDQPSTHEGVGTGAGIQHDVDTLVTGVWVAVALFCFAFVLLLSFVAHHSRPGAQANNRINAADGVELGKALLANSTLRGLHLAGNEVACDAEGYVVDRRTLPSSYSAIPMERADSTSANTATLLKKWGRTTSAMGKRRGRTPGSKPGTAGGLAAGAARASCFSTSRECRRVFAGSASGADEPPAAGWSALMPIDPDAISAAASGAEAAMGAVGVESTGVMWTEQDVAAATSHAEHRIVCALVVVCRRLECLSFS